MKTFVSLLVAAALCAALPAPESRAAGWPHARAMYRTDVTVGGETVMLGQYATVNLHNAVSDFYGLVGLTAYVQHLPHPGGRGQGQMYFGFHPKNGTFRLVVVVVGKGEAVYESDPVSGRQTVAALRLISDSTGGGWPASASAAVRYAP